LKKIEKHDIRQKLFGLKGDKRKQAEILDTWVQDKFGLTACHPGIGDNEKNWDAVELAKSLMMP